MPTTSFFPLLIGFVLIVAAVASAVLAPRMPVVIRITAAMIFLMLALYCVYGFMAAMEPSESAMFFRIAFPLLFVSCLAALGRLAFARSVLSKEQNLDFAAPIMSMNPYEAGNSSAATSKTRSTRWMVWSGVILLSLSAITVIATFFAIFGSYMDALDASSTPQPNNSPSATLNWYIPLLCAPAFALVGLGMLIVGYFRRQPAK